MDVIQTLHSYRREKKKIDESVPNIILLILERCKKYGLENASITSTLIDVIKLTALNMVATDTIIRYFVQNEQRRILRKATSVSLLQDLFANKDSTSTDLSENPFREEQVEQNGDESEGLEDNFLYIKDEERTLVCKRKSETSLFFTSLWGLDSTTSADNGNQQATKRLCK